MPGRAAELLVEIHFGQAGDSDAFVGEGWGPAEPDHRWTLGPHSVLHLPPAAAGPNRVLVLDMLPWCDARSLPQQTVMLAVNDRLLATVHIFDHRVLAFALPSGLPAEGKVRLTFSHLNAHTPRAAGGFHPSGPAFGLLMLRLRVYRLTAAPGSQQHCPRIAGCLADGSLQVQAEALTGLPPASLARRFEPIGHNCEFSRVQHQLGAYPVGLLRFANVVTHALVEGLVHRFHGIGRAQTLRVFVDDPPDGDYKVQDEVHYVWYGTGKAARSTTPDAIRQEQCRRLQYLQRKFEEDLAEGGKIYVLTRAEPLSHPEALAAFCALGLHGPNVLLWTTHGDPARTGQVDHLLPGFLLGHLGLTDDVVYATTDAWLSVMANALTLSGLNSDR